VAPPPLLGQAQIVIDQATLGPGVAGRARNDGVLGEVVTLRNADNTNVLEHRWVLATPRGSAATLSSPGSASCQFEPDEAGTYVLTLYVNEGTGRLQKHVSLFAIRSSTGLRYPGQGEGAEANWTSIYTGDPNETGWWEDLIEALRAATAVKAGVEALLDVAANPENLVAVRTFGAPVHDDASYGQFNTGVECITDANYATVVGGFRHTASGPYSTVVGGYFSTASGDSAYVGGGRQHTASGEQATVSGGLDNTASGDFSAIAGGSGNSAGENSFVGGGLNNNASNAYNVIAGGTSNLCAAEGAVIGGGELNESFGTYSTISGGSTNATGADYTVVAGGFTNQAGAEYAVVGGGDSNTAGGARSVVAGGGENATGGDWSTVIGGRACQTNGDYSVAGGRGAIANMDYSIALNRGAFSNHEGAVVIKDGNVTTLVSTTDHELLLGFHGGVRILGCDSPENGRRIVQGDQQTTDATAQAVTLFAVPANQVVRLKGVITGKRSGTNAVRVHYFEGSYYNVGGVVTLLTGALLLTTAQADGLGAGYATGLAISGTNVQVTFTGTVAHTVAWVWDFDLTYGGAS